MYLPFFGRGGDRSEFEWIFWGELDNLLRCSLLCRPALLRCTVLHFERRVVRDSVANDGRVERVEWGIGLSRKKKWIETVLCCVVLSQAYTFVKLKVYKLKQCRMLFFRGIPWRPHTSTSKSGWLMRKCTRIYYPYGSPLPFPFPSYSVVPCGTHGIVIDTQGRPMEWVIILIEPTRWKSWGRARDGTLLPGSVSRYGAFVPKWRIWIPSSRIFFLVWRVAPKAKKYGAF